MRVMIIGASSNRAKFGNRALRAYARQGHEVFAVNPNEAEVEGMATYPDVSGPPGPIDRATVYVPPRIGVTLMAPLAARGDVGEVWLNPGADDPEVVEEAERVGLRVVTACAILDIGESPYA